jgi:non-specific serine/threonine protein kinase/serine/threonine-protein kinase
MGIHPGEASAPDYWDRVEEVFTAALATEVSARTAVLDAGCAGRADLRAEVEALLAAHDRAGDFITPPPVGEARPAPEACAPGTRIGAFRLTERIAHGGMGDVYRAERVEGEFTQQVAIKLIAGRLQGADTVRRFRDERQILASLQHPHIVTLVDGGVTADGQPFIAMEYVDGLAITELCRQQAVGIEARLALFQQVCAAVGFAHRHLVVHRDLKPGNVLVTRDGVVKVLDFGVAKLLEPQAAASGTTLSLVGPMTPNYASPEQVRGLPVTTAADIYALGVLLYELVAGQRPYETSGKPLEEVLSIVVVREPQRPSERCASDLPYDGRRIRGDLDAIVRKAMAKDPAQRYASAEELRDDLTRVLAGQPVVAREPSFAYVARKAIARHRAAFFVGATLLTLLVAALAGALWQARVAARERERAVARFNDVRQLAGALIFKIHDEVLPLAGSTPVRETIIAEGLKFLARLEQDAGGDPSLQLELARAYLRIGAVQGTSGAANLGLRAAALQSYRKARDLAAPLAGRVDPPWEAVLTLVDAQLALANVGEGEERRDATSAALESATAWHRREPGSGRARALLARAHFQMARLIGQQGALPHLLESNRLFREVHAENPGDLAKVRNVALTEKYLGGFFEEGGDLDRALEHHRRAYALDEQRVAAAPDDRQAQLDFAIDISNIAYALLLRNENAEAIKAYHRTLEIRQRLAASDPKDVYMRGRVAFVHDKLAELYLRTGEITRAQDHSRTSVTLNDAAGPLAVAPHQVVDSLRTLGDSERAAGRGEAACAAYGRSLTTYRGIAEARRLPSQRIEMETVERAFASCGKRPG